MGYKDDWNKVCEHVGTRTQDECILQFLRLPIEDPYLEDPDAGLHQQEATALGPLAYQPIPFSKAGNPIMSTVAFLASVVDPRIASSAAMDEFCRIKDEVPAQLLDSHIKNVAENAANNEGKVDGNAGLTKSGIAGTEPEDEKKDEESKESEKKEESKDSDEKKDEDKKDTAAEKKEKKDDEAMDVDKPEDKKKDDKKEEKDKEKKDDDKSETSKAEKKEKKD